MLLHVQILAYSQPTILPDKNHQNQFFKNIGTNSSIGNSGQTPKLNKPKAKCNIGDNFDQ